MILVKTRISLDDFILKMLSTPPERLMLDPFQDWVANLQLSDNFLNRYIEFGDRTYTRKRICQNWPIPVMKIW